ncbi:2Fe-2S iron-sulfur cluster-binding protein [Cerasicoccus arenae]|uniref:(2Fe-2S)-binding protein n=1 Tax=Cerasicoccus arenae TaxID=424488 RepID=A0A8J3GEW2_9BACT|nr:2Fe-2S iron-sulfur cluster-binding protein [Cerasicoccus arenae]MBK1856628.1 (2Fe-2S)-binding protein [Cerasicoccus arenae]GHC12361.1 (2Fe-2S)-binding protein [Cerasicoccus arenae]
MADSETKQVTINIDGVEHRVPDGLNLVDACEGVGVEIPHYCYHPKLSVAGNCRMCLVEMGMPMRDRATGEPVLDDAGAPKIGWMPKPAIACASKAMPGLHIKTKSDLTKECREGVMEFLLVNHPLDCPICDQAGECRLQEFATDYGRGFSRFVEEKNVKPKRTKLGPRVILDDERCILCSRCVRFCEEIDENPVLGFTERGSHSTLSCFPGKQLDSNYSLNTVDICPVGALTSTDFRFKMRVWFLKPTPSICTESSVGVNTEVWTREGKIYRITPRRNDAVNDTWMTDSGRSLYQQVEAENRMKSFRVDGNKASLGEAVQRVRELLTVGPVAYVASGHMSVEDQWMLRKLAEAEPGAIHFVYHTGEGDGRLISKDKTPNLRGGLLTGLIKGIPDAHLHSLRDKLEAGEIKTIVSFGEDIVKAGISPELIKKANLVYFGALRDDCTDYAKVLLPALTVFERSGSFVNQQFRLQKFSQIVPGPAGLLPTTALLARLIGEITGQPATAPSNPQMWREIAAAVPQFSGVEFAKIPTTGLELDSSAFATLPFVEEKGWHFEPVAEPAGAQSSHH